MANITGMKPAAKELHERMGPSLYRAAYNEGMSLSAWLETQDPSDEYKDGLDAFQRQLKIAGIRTANVPEWGVWADEFAAFEKTEQARSLAPEWIARQWRSAMLPSERKLYLSQDSVPGSWALPWAEAVGPRQSSYISPAVPLSALVALTTPITGDAYRAYYLTVDSDELHMARVAEGAEVPRVKLTGGDRTVRLYKFGRTLETSYEQLRRMRLNRIALHINLLAAQAEVDKVTVALDTIINGDGNSGTSATSYNLTTLDSAASAGTLTLKGWLAYKMKFANPYSLTVALCQEAVALQLLMLNTGSANTPLVNIQAASGFGSFSQINPGLRDNVALGWLSGAPTLKIVGIDSRMSLEQVVEVGADIQEIERWATRQVQTLTMTEVNGFAIFDANAALILDVNA